MSVKSILNTKGSAVETIEPNARAQEAALLMEERKIGALVVTTGDFVAGLLTHRDLAKGLAGYGAKLALTPVKDLMQDFFLCVSPEESTPAVMALMTRRRATHIPVMDRGRLMRIVSIGDVVKDRLQDLELHMRVLRGPALYVARLALHTSQRWAALADDRVASTDRSRELRSEIRTLRRLD